VAASPTVSATTAAIKTVLLAISNIGNVYDRPRRAYPPSEFRNLFVDSTDDRYRVWFIDVTMTDDEEDAAGFLFLVRRTITIEGFLGWADDPTTYDTQAKFRELCEAVQSAIESEDTIFGAAPLATDVTTQITIDLDYLGDVMCHHALVTLQVESEETKS
jgi:hypothetical protein